jgi:prevent-host-death family protein
MSTVGVRELKNRLTRYLRETKRGGEIVITERGNPIAVIQSLGKGKPASSLEARLAELAARGVVTLPSRRARKEGRLIALKGAPLSRTVLEDRR